MKLLTTLTTICLILLCTLCYSQNIVDKITKIDNSMYQGTVAWEATSRGITTSSLLSYTSNGQFKETIKQNDIIIYKYCDGKDFFSVANDTKVIENINKNDMATSKIFNISNNPSFCYGRGLSKLKNISYNPQTNQLSGFWIDGTKIIASLNPSLDYAAYKIERFSKDVKMSTIENSNPILVDKKYHIFSESKRTIFSGSEILIKIKSITFEEPKSDEYNFISSNSKISDLRTGTHITYDKDKVDGMSSEELLKESKKLSKEIAKTEFDEKSKEANNNRNRNIQIMLLIFIFISTVAFVIKQLKKNK